MITLSATYPSYMAVYVTRYMRAATFVRLNIVDPSLRGIKQYFKITPYSNMPNISFDYKVDSLIKFLSQVQFQQCIIFTNYQLKADSLCKTLSSKGYPSIFISGNIDQNERNNAISQLKEFKCRILVSTDLTSRGIDAENVDLIICMDLPSDPETYLHRIGRAGRYGCEGLAVSFICEKDEASQFETIIDAYNLRVIQFDDNLQDIVSSRNEIKDQFRLDDVTIQKVEISKEELDRSLFEYEQFKNSSIKFNRIIKNNDMDLGKKSLIRLNNPILNEIIEPNLMENTENYFLNRTNFNEKIDLNTIQNNFIGLKNQNKFKSNDILNLKLKFKNDLESKINKEAIHKSEIKNEIINLNEMYKWKQATKKETKKITAIEDQSYLYAYYYNYYFKNYLSQINNN
jgi:superfamily II DNA/RNA helicase